MALVANKRSVMTLYSNPICPYSHQVRIVLAEKGVSVDILNVEAHDRPEDLIELNPYCTVPTLVDRELVLYQAGIIMEYLDERFPHPPLMPVYPVARAEARRMMYRIENDWYSLLQQILHGKEEDKKTAREQLHNSFLAIAPAFSEKPYFLSDEFTLIDCKLAPLLWRLHHIGIHMSDKAKPIHKYLAHVADRDSFQVSLSERERDMRPDLVK